MNYLDRAQDDLETALLLLSPVGNPTQDVGKFDIAAYHIQQSMEKGLKHILHDICGISDEERSFRTHNLPYLIRWAESVSDYRVSDELKAVAVDVTGWEAKSRYSSSAVSTQAEIMEAANCCSEFLENIQKTCKGNELEIPMEEQEKHKELLERQENSN